MSPVPPDSDVDPSDVHPSDVDPSDVHPSDGGGKPPVQLVWDWSPRERRQRPTREAYVTAAIRVADTDGLEAVSVRRVAAELATRPMDLYTSVGRKEDLNDLMVDEVMGEAVLAEVPRPWRPGLAAIAHATLAVCLAHPWLLEAGGQRRNIGPNVMRHLEQALQATAELPISPAKRLSIVFAVDTYVLGHVQGSLVHGGHAGPIAQDWHSSAMAHLQRLFASGEFPQLAAYGAKSVLSDRYLERSFNTRLKWLLDGIADDVNGP